jgi:hypothetical protein
LIGYWVYLLFAWNISTRWMCVHLWAMSGLLREVKWVRAQFSPINCSWADSRVKVSLWHGCLPKNSLLNSVAAEAWDHSTIQFLLYSTLNFS